MKRILPLLAATLLSFYQMMAQCLTISSCPSAPVVVCDFNNNDNKLWNATYWYDNVIGSHDLAEGFTDFSITATNTCFTDALSFRYQLFLDLNNDGVMETVVDSKTPPPAGRVYYGNAANPNYSGGTLKAFDQRPVPPLLKYNFGMQVSGTGNVRTAKMRWRTDVSPVRYKIPRLPYGTHKIKWFVETALGEETICEYVFTVKDCKKPSVNCLNGFSVNLMPTHMITLWATDFLQNAQDNVTPDDQLKFAIRKSGSGTGFPVDANGNPVASVTFTCDEIGPQSVELWVIDKAGNADFCASNVLIQDNVGNCMPNSNAPLKVCLQQYCSGAPIENAAVQLSGAGPGIPSFYFGFVMMDTLGCTYFPLNAFPISANTYITPTKDDNDLNGVTTYDIALIQAHLDGTQPFTEPWQFIAADIDKNNAITFNDIAVLQNLISGVYTEFPNNTSWRFIPAGFVFPNPANPFAFPFPESELFSNISSAGDSTVVFRGIKIGDVNCSAVGFGPQIPVERSTPKMVLQTIVSPPQPNPTSGNSTISLQLAHAGKVRLDLFDLSARTIYSIENQMDAGPGILTIPMDTRFVPGIYFWKVLVDGAVYSGKLVIE